MNKKISTFTLIIYTILNLYVFGAFAFHYQWNYEILVKGDGMILFSLVISIFLNAALIIYYLNKHGESKK
ncbi:MAG: hypothetical protein WC219_06475 [Acholeplasmataceae bacterium]